MNTVRQEIKVLTTKGHTLSATKFSSERSIGKTLLISSATGVLQKYYQKFAYYFAEQGFIVYTFDYSGIGKSGSPIAQLLRNSTNLKEWGSIDQAALTAYIKKEYPDNEIFLLAHSIGGQIIGFNTHYEMVDKLVLVASQNGYWNYYKGLNKAKMWLFWYLVVPFLTKWYGYFPAKKLGLFENLPRNMALQWCKWGKSKDFMMHDYNQEEYFFDRMELPLLSWSFPKDIYAPKKAVDWLTDQYSSSTKERIHYIPPKNQISKLQHFGFFRETFKDTLWKMTLEWLIKNEK